MGHAGDSFIFSNNKTYLRVDLPAKSTNEAINCFDEKNKGPDLNVYALNDDTYVPREDKCNNYEAPLMYLLFGTKKILLIDIGTTVPSTSFPIRWLIEDNINNRCIMKKKQRKYLEIVIVYSHHRLSYMAGDQ